MKQLNDVEALRREVTRLRQSGTVAFVPTMGNLHAGHLYLMREAKKHASAVVASIFVNPLQFGANEDLDQYPRTLEADREALDEAGVDLLYAPTVEQMYPQPMALQTKVEVPELGRIHCGSSRPGHFAGVTTVVNKLFNMVQPDVALFGKKDYQQLLLIRRMVEDLAMPLRIVGVETQRDVDGLALSSRNQYLSDVERGVAPKLYEQLQWLRDRLQEGQHDFVQLCEQAREQLRVVGFVPDYLSVVDPYTLRLPHANARQLVVLAAAQLGSARLIDNIEVTRE